MTQPVEPQTSAQRNDGSYDIVDGNKVRISTASGQQSVLFEDIASLGYNRMTFTVSGDNHGTGQIFFIGGIIMGFVLMFNWDFLYGLGIGAVVTIIGVILLNQTNQIYWDRITVETKGGKIIAFDVDDGVGKGKIDEIETEKRKGLSG